MVCELYLNKHIIFKWFFGGWGEVFTGYDAGAKLQTG